MQVDRDAERLDLSLIIQAPEGLTRSTDAQSATPGSFLNARILRFEGTHPILQQAPVEMTEFQQRTMS